MSGEPPAMPVILEETEEDVLHENFRVTPLMGKYRPPAMPVILEETEEDLLHENFRVLLARNKKYRTPTMPTIPEETLHELLWAATGEVPARQQMKSPTVLLTATSSTSDDSGDAYMIMSGEPPAMPVILEETEEDVLRENFRVTPLMGKFRPPAMPVILEETEKDLE